MRVLQDSLRATVFAIVIFALQANLVIDLADKV